MGYLKTNSSGGGVIQQLEALTSNYTDLLDVLKNPTIVLNGFAVSFYPSYTQNYIVRTTGSDYWTSGSYGNSTSYGNATLTAKKSHKLLISRQQGSGHNLIASGTKDLTISSPTFELKNVSVGDQIFVGIAGYTVSYIWGFSMTHGILLPDSFEF